MNEDIFKDLNDKLPGIQIDVLMSKQTTFKIGGPAEYFFSAKTKDQLIKSVKLAKEIGLPVFVFGGGSNLLVSSEGVKGLVVKNQIEKPIELKESDIIEAPCGVVLGEVVDFAIKNSLKGSEWAGGLPGTFGGAIRGNAGAFGGEIKDTLFQVEALDNNFEEKTLSNKECDFSYRNSIFKQKNWIVVSAQLKLEKGDKKELRDIANSRIDYRKERHPLEYPNAGSIFKNIDFKEVPEKFKDEFKDKVKQDPFEIVPAAWFIIGAGLTGKQIGKAQISQKHSNYIVNLGGATAKDVLELIEFAKNSVKEKYGIILEAEIQAVGF